MRLERSDLELEVLVNRIQRRELDLQPDYQRGEVWDRARKQRLIDTILRDWYIPAIHIVMDQELGKELVLDGQQRLRTIRAFFLNEVRVAGSIEPTRDDLRELDGLLFKDLPEAIRRRVQRFRITVVTLSDYMPEEPAELFFRLNQQYALTPPEKRNALYGKARDSIKDIVLELTERQALTAKNIGFSNGRLAYDDVISRFCVALTNGSFRVQVRNSDVETFYRHRDFPDFVVSRAISAGISLGKALNHVGGVKLNKATLFTWLAFVDYFHGHGVEEISVDFIRDFEKLRSSAKSSSAALESKAHRLVQIYADRASYRVLDVSSVLLRDICLHGVYSLIAEPIGIQIGLSSFLMSIDHSAVDEEILLEYANSMNWGAIR